MRKLETGKRPRRTDAPKMPLPSGERSPSRARGLLLDLLALPADLRLLEISSGQPSSLPIKSPLILQPSPIPLYTAHLLPIVIRHGIVRTRTSRINSVLLDPFVKTLLLGHEFTQTAPVQRSPCDVAEERTNEPAGAHAGKSGQARGDHWVEGDDAHDGVLEMRVCGQCSDCRACCGNGAENGGDEGVAATGGAQLEKAVPVEGSRERGGGGDVGGRS